MNGIRPVVRASASYVLNSELEQDQHLVVSVLANYVIDRVFILFCLRALTRQALRQGVASTLLCDPGRTFEGRSRSPRNGEELTRTQHLFDERNLRKL